MVYPGPRELIIFDSAAIPVVNGVGSKFTKGPWYDMFEPSLHTFRDKKLHSQRRRIWDRAFSIKGAFAELESTLPTTTCTDINLE